MAPLLLTLALLSVCTGVEDITLVADPDCPQAQAIHLKGHSYLNTIIPCHYVKEHLPPTNNSEPVGVEFTMYIQDINSINAADMDFRVDLFLHMTWEDTRLTLYQLVGNTSRETDHLTLPAYVIDHLWTPDPYITNAKDAAITKLTTTYASVTLYKNHTIRYSARVYSTIACQMVFYGYPMDIQTCATIMQSFMYSPKEVEFNWREWSPVMINKDLKLLQFQLHQPLNNTIKMSSQDELGHGDRNVRQLIVELQFSREIGHHLVQTFVPSFLVVALSWFSFWLGLEAIPGRVTLLVTSLLIITTLFSGIKEGLPPVAYVKAIDVWMAGCMVFIFAALGEFVVVRVLNVMHTNKHPPTPPPPPPSLQYQQPTHPPAILHSPEPKQETEGDFYRRVTLSHNNTNTSTTTTTTNNKIIDMAENGLGSAAMRAWDPESASGATRPHSGATSTQNPPIGRISLEWVDTKTGKKKILWKEIDKTARIVFPVMFLLFMVIYFPILISRIF